MAVITEKNNLYLWGDNTYGQLGNGKKAGWYFGDSNKECWFKPKKVIGRCGSCSYRKRKNYCYQNGWQQMGYRNRIWK